MSLPSDSGAESAAGRKLKQEWREIDQFVQSAITDGVFQGAVLHVGRPGASFVQAYGGKAPEGVDADYSRPMAVDTVFDLGSLTGSLVATTLVMKMVEAAKLNVHDRVSRIVQGMGVGNRSSTTVAQLLSQASGLPSYSFYDDLVRLNAGARFGLMTSKGAKQYVYDQIAKLPLRSEPGARQHYSDLNFILLGQVCELLSGLSLDRAFQKFVTQPLGLRSMSFIDLSSVRFKGFTPVLELFAPAGQCSKRDRLIAGEVFDDTAAAMGGVAGHAGLFATANDVFTLLSELIKSYKGKSTFLKPDTLKLFWGTTGENTARQWRFGWEGIAKENGLVDSALAMEAVGAVGSLGSFVWVDPVKDYSVVFLSNANFSGHVNKRLAPFRGELLNVIHRVMPSGSW